MDQFKSTALDSLDDNDLGGPSLENSLIDEKGKAHLLKLSDGPQAHFRKRPGRLFVTTHKQTPLRITKGKKHATYW